MRDFKLEAVSLRNCGNCGKALTKPVSTEIAGNAKAFAQLDAIAWEMDTPSPA